ncbi:hypothetical protein [Cupriavidus sp. D384]|uniref:hypothetical protein n=1 Tax=Cupriavidus sp. D384 TaxID=1538095 RepID=UPI001E5D6CDE|nr:hypothetical protein [Cupriavidus sp. D384]
MSLATLHTDARRVAQRLRRIPPSVAAWLCSVDPTLALSMQDWLTSPAWADTPPEAFTAADVVPCFALVKISVSKPAVFWAALVAIPSFPILLALRWI